MMDFWHLPFHHSRELVKAQQTRAALELSFRQRWESNPQPFGPGYRPETCALPTELFRQALFGKGLRLADGIFFMLHSGATAILETAKSAPPHGCSMTHAANHLVSFPKEPSVRVPGVHFRERCLFVWLH
ncbi:unnamed protein product [Protopolystoma xenopodis]|uniref:Uncharacterized protein n=1 Tax=Protopolystoma xenopodis TaxID=117903 RepID=A0A3S5AT25_9PLAT|nr:unnamed protein product [Protopolystoma xenopodis]